MQPEDETKPAADAGPVDLALGPLPEVVRRADHHYNSEGLAGAVRAYAAAAVAAERERWEGIVCNALDLYDRLETRRGMEMLADLVAHKRA
jgi:hypothetical protein